MPISAALAGHATEPHAAGHGSKLNWPRDGVLGANDGIVSVAALLLGIIATGAGSGTISPPVWRPSSPARFPWPWANTCPCRPSGTPNARGQGKAELKNFADEEHAELAGILAGYGISPETAHRAATEIHAADALPAHLRLELGMEAEELTSPIAAAIASACAFILGALLPLIAVLVVPQSVAAWAVTGVTLVALVLTGFISAALAGTSKLRSCLRLLIGGALGLALTYFAGALFGGAA